MKVHLFLRQWFIPAAFTTAMLFLVATQRLYMSVCPSVRWLVRPSVTLLHFGLLGATYGRVSGLAF